jgi:hypothetical protein
MKHINRDTFHFFSMMMIEYVHVLLVRRVTDHSFQSQIA